MDESDNMLLNSVRQLGIVISQRVQRLGELNSQDLQSICLQFLQAFRVDITHIKQLGKNQKFRIATKINQELTKNFGTQFELNDIMNPNINFIRKLIVTLMSKMAMNENQGKQVEQQFQSNEQANRRFIKQKKIQTINNWIKKQWIHPSLNSVRTVHFESHRLKYDINEDIQKRNILKDFSTKNLKYNMQASLAEMMNHYFLAKKKFTADQGIIINKQAAAGDRLQQIKQNNREDWVALKKNTKKVNKLKKKLIEETKQVTNQQVIENNEATIFQKQVENLAQQQRIKEQSIKKTQQKQQKVNQEPTNEDPLGKLKLNIDKIKKSHSAEIEELLNTITKKQLKIAKIEEKQIKIEEDMVVKEEKIIKLKQALQKTKKQAESKQLLLNTIQVPQEMKEEVKSMRQQLKQIQVEAKKQTVRLQQQIKTLQNDGNQKLKVLTEMKQKLVKIQEDYIKINRQILQKQNQKKKVKIPQAGISRNYYNKRISQMQIRWKQGKKEIEKVSKELTTLQQSIGINISVSGRIETQIENLLNLDKQKNQTLNKTIKQLYQKYKISFKDTIKAMNNVTEVKSQSREYQSQVAQISGKNYKVNIQKLNFAIEDIRKQKLQQQQLLQQQQQQQQRRR